MTRCTCMGGPRPGTEQFMAPHLSGCPLNPDNWRKPVCDRCGRVVGCRNAASACKCEAQDGSPDG